MRLACGCPSWAEHECDQADREVEDSGCWACDAGRHGACELPWYPYGDWWWVCCCFEDGGAVTAVYGERPEKKAWTERARPVKAGPSGPPVGEALRGREV